MLCLSLLMLLTLQSTHGSPPTETVSIKEVSISDGEVGEVWLCGGQSNMVVPVSYASDSTDDLLSTPFDVRFHVNGKWVKATASNASNLPAVPFFFALTRYRATGKPVGVIVAAEGGTGIEAWLSAEAMPGTEIGQKMRRLSETPEVIEAARLDRAEKPMLPYGKHRLAHWGLGRAYPSELYQKKVVPLKGTPITGIIWYQGESNADSSAMAAEYDVWLKSLISSWRKLFGEVPFLIVELPNYISPTAETPTSWDDLRAEQKRCAAAVSGTYWIPAFDLGDENNIHPTRKRAMGERIAEFVSKHRKKSQVKRIKICERMARAKGTKTAKNMGLKRTILQKSLFRQPLVCTRKRVQGCWSRFMRCSSPNCCATRAKPCGRKTKAHIRLVDQEAPQDQPGILQPEDGVFIITGAGRVLERGKLEFPVFAGELGGNGIAPWVA